MQTLSLALLPLILAASPAPRATITPDDRGVVKEVRVGKQVFLTDLGVALTGPGWNGNQGDQRGMAPAGVTRTREGEATITSGMLEKGSYRTRFRQVFRPTATGARLEYELVPETDVPVENVLLLGRVPVAGHAGATRYTCAAEDTATGVLPKELNALGYRFLNGRACDWLALVDPDGLAVRIKPENLTLGMQDDRKFRSDTFGLHAIFGGSRTLKAGVPVRFALEISADTAAAVDADAARVARQNMASIPLTAKAPLRAGKATLDQAAVSVFERVEITPEITATFDNPFDPEDVAVDAEITLPGGKRVSIPGFYYVPFQVEIRDGRERMKPSGPATWKVRFTPIIPGTYRAVVRVRDRSGKAECPPVTFTAKAGARPGFVRVAEQSPRYFRLDDGSPYFAVGENVCWAGASTPLRDYSNWFRGLGGAGANWARLWLANNEKGLEWMPNPTARPGRGTYLGLGRYALDNSWRLDEVVRLAEENGIRLMFCIGTFGEIKNTPDYFNANLWESNPYNVANGGPCRTPKEFFTDPLARKLYQRRLRYILARWGYSPQVFAWEFWNEYTAPAAWVQEMAAYLKAHDVNRHLVSTTYGTDDVWKLPEVDFTMTHLYGDSGNVADFGDIIQQHAGKHRVFEKPYILAEFGIDWRTSDTKYDPRGKGMGLHNGLWAGVLSGGAGTPMLWYWDGYVHPKNLYSVFTPVTKFVRSVDWTKQRFEPLEGIGVRNVVTGPERYSDLAIPAGVGWGRAGTDTYVLGNDGSIQGGPVASTVGSPKRHTPSELHMKLTFNLEMPAEGQFIATLGTVSSRAHLQIRLDGNLLVDQPLAAGPMGEGPWKAARYLDQWKLWQCDYDQDYVVRVPAGKHTLTIENADGDWLSFRGYRVTNYRSNRYPEVRALGLRADRTTLLWLHHQQSTWRSVLDGKEPDELSALRVTLPGTPDGRYQVEWWDTFTGAITRTDTVTARGGALELTPAPFRRDVAVIVRPAQ